MQFPSCRLLTRNQVLLFEDVEQSSISPDKVTVFGLRPPELLFVEKLKDYFSWFVSSKYAKKKSVTSHESLLNVNLTKNYWVDRPVVKLRPRAVAEFIQLCQMKCSNDRNRQMKQELLKHVCPKLTSGPQSCICFKDI